MSSHEIKNRSVPIPKRWRASSTAFTVKQGNGRGPVRARVRDRPHTGRPPHKLKLVVRVIRPLLSRGLRRYGYQAMICMSD